MKLSDVFKALGSAFGEREVEDIVLERDEADMLKALPYESSPAAIPKGQYVEPAGAANIRMDETLSERSEVREGLDYKQLEAMSHVPLISAILSTRINQIAEFAVPERDGINIGFQIKLKDSTSVPTEEDIQRINELYAFMLTCGDPRIGIGNTFESFLRMLAFDSLVYDQACFEIVRNKQGQVCAFHNVDSATIRLAKISDAERRSGLRDPDATRYVQLWENKILAEFKYEDLCFGIRRPRSGLRHRGYGHPELSECVGLITNLLNTELYNAANFTSGVNVNGILAVKTRMNPSMFRQFRREFYAMLNGSGNSRKTPLIQLSPDDNEGIQAVNLGASNREMEFQSWHSTLIKQICAVFSIDPFEIGLKYGSEGQGSALNETSGITRLGMSKDKGLRPFLRNIQTWLNHYVMSQLDDRFVLHFCGLDSVSPREQLDRDRLKVTTYMTLNELRSSFDLPPVDGGDVILNEYYLRALDMQQRGLEVAEPATALQQPPKPDEDTAEEVKAKDKNADGKDDKTGRDLPDIGANAEKDDYNDGL